MRKLSSALIGVLLAGLAAFAPAAAPAALAAAPANPKVAIIVGATHGETAKYRSNADELYAEAIKYTPNVVKVYSPKATWAAVKAAVNGASIVIYLGHGNGTPSPYPTDAKYTTKDGFGLNYDVNGDGKLSDNELKYYGEPSIATLTPAPNAVVMLFHLCYASGNSEPGNPAPTLGVARQRVDNYAAGFLKMGARAVLVDGHSHSPYYIRALFSTKQTIEQLWRSAPNFHNHVITYGSVRSPGYSSLMDPDSASSGYYRALTGRLSLRTEDVTGAKFAEDDGTGAFSPNGDGSQDTYSLRVGLAESTDWRIAITDGSGNELSSTNGTGQNATIDWSGIVGGNAVPDGTYHWSLEAGSGWSDPSLQREGDLVVDTVAPSLSGVSAAADPIVPISPNADGYRDTASFAVNASEAGSIVTTVKHGSTPVAEFAADTTGAAMTVAWNGRNTAGSVVADGTYQVELKAMDRAGNSSPTQAQTVTVYSSLGFVKASTTPFFPQDGDKVARTTTFSFKLATAATVDWMIVNAAGTKVRTIKTGEALAAGSFSFAWNGRNDLGAYVGRGTYRAVVAATNGSLASTQTAAAIADAFRISSSDTTPARHQRITVTTKTAEALRTAPRVTIYQPGIGRYSVTMTRVSAGVYRASITLKSSSTGTVRILVSGTDVAKHYQASSLYLPLH